MHKSTRRDFIKVTLAGAGACLATRSTFAAPGEALPVRPSNATDTVLLGKTGIRTSFLAQGTGFNGYSRSSDHTRMGQEKFSTLLHHGLDQGVRFLDMADLYGSHPFVREAVKGVGRDKLALLSKIWPRKEDWNTPSGGAIEEVDRFRQELGVDTVDIVLIHCMTDAKWVDQYERIRDDLSQLKQKGTVRAVGVSCHDHGALKAAAAHPWVDVIFARINHKGGKDYFMDGSVEEVSQTLRTARANGKAVVGMKLFGAGKIVAPEEKDASLRYVLSNQLVDAMTIGMLKTSEIDDTVRRLNQTAKSLKS